MKETGPTRVPRVGVGAVILHNGALLMVKRGKPPREGEWAVPGGKVRWGESLSDAVSREVTEETGLSVAVGDLLWTGETIGPDWHFVLMDFEATVVDGELVAGDDAADVAWVHLDEVDRYPVTSSMHELIELLRRRTNAG
ncbi:MAG: NUDIX hydrolase [Acidimicrobiia bacterium]|nr:NUDIX hydrolase [Acidimicrobiia bacterium]